MAYVEDRFGTDETLRRLHGAFIPFLEHCKVRLGDAMDEHEKANLLPHVMAAAKTVSVFDDWGRWPRDAVRFLDGYMSRDELVERVKQQGFSVIECTVGGCCAPNIHVVNRYIMDEYRSVMAELVANGTFTLTIATRALPPFIWHDCYPSGAEHGKPVGHKGGISFVPTGISGTDAEMMMYVGIIAEYRKTHPLLGGKAAS